MSEKKVFTADQARAAGEQIGIDWGTSRFDVEQFRMGMDVELEHGTHDQETNVTGDDVVVTAKIARAPSTSSPPTTPAWRSWRPRPRRTGLLAARIRPAGEAPGSSAPPARNI